MSARWEWYESDDTTLSSFLSFSPTNGIVTVAQQLNLWNDQGETDGTGSEDFLVTAVSRNAGVGDYTMDDELAANGWIEARLIGSSGDAAAQTSGWTRLGRGRYMRITNIPRDSARNFEFRVNIPVGSGVVAKDVKVRVIEGLRAISLEIGHYEGGAQGFVMGVGDTEFTEVLSGFVMTPQGSPDNTVDISAGIYVHEGIPKALLAATFTLTNTDSAAAALVAGEEYFNLVSVGASGFTHTKSLKGTAPLPESSLPDVPDGEVSLGYIIRPFDATISAGDIHQDDGLPLHYGSGAIVGTGLSPEIHPFTMMCGNNLIVSPSPFEIILTDADVNYVWIEPSGAVTVELTGVQPSDRAMLAYEITTAASAITVLRDCRHWIYPNPVEVTLSVAGTLAVTTSKGYGVLPTKAQAYLLPIGGVVASLGSTGTASAATTWEIKASERGAAFTTIFTSADATQYPSIAYNEADPTDFDAFPEDFSFLGGTRFESTVTAIPGGTSSSNQTIVLRFSAVGAA